jgi:hypothetical protein
MGILRRLRGVGDSRGVLPSGAFTVDSEGIIIASTVSSRFPPQVVHEIARIVLRTFADAVKNGSPLTELKVKFGAMSIRAVEMRGGALVFLSPRGEQQNRLHTTR